MQQVIWVLLFIGVLTFFSMFFTVKQQSIAVIERFGKFIRIAQAGLSMKLPFIDRVVARVNLRVQQLDVGVDTKTDDDVFVHMKVSVQYTVMPDKVYDAFYKLSNVNEQVTSFVFDVVRARVPGLKLDDVYSKKDEIADAVKNELQHTMDAFGYSILKALVTDIDPDEKVKIAMNEINAATRMRMAATEKGEADRILKVKAAEAEAQSKALQGRGIADQRKAIIHGLQDSVEEFRNAVAGSTANDVMMLVLMTQYFDTLKEIAEHSKATTIMVPNSPGGLGGLVDQVREVLFTSSKLSQTPDSQQVKPPKIG